ncbi:MAG: tRNA pseudouridine(55) synthase TruB [Coxiellaceae bacterium]|nr:tRNA pseudouridine(55) synthase TruB [Coxiellaceae bacterium]
MNGIFLLDKPIGLSSNHALQRVKRLFQAKKAGHTGTLDPLASGMLPICLGEATKFSQYVLDCDKTYLVTMQLGVRTNTSDAEGEIIATKTVPHFSLQNIDAAFDAFRGNILQIPTMFSALKHNGIPLYDYARRGITIDRAARPITLYNIAVLSIDNHFVNYMVKCSSGTYVRTLTDDVGEKLGCGAHVTQLRRLSVGKYLEKDMITLEQLQTLEHPERYLLPMDTAVDHFPILMLSEASQLALQQGKVIAGDDAKIGLVRLYSENQGFFGMGEVMSDGRLISKRLINPSNN